MKKIFVAITLVILLSLTAVSCFATEKAYVNDYACLLTEQENTKLDEYLSRNSEQTNMDIVFVTVSGDYSQYVSTSPASIAEFADDYYDYNGYKDDGLVFVIDIKNREYYVSTSGYAIYVYGDKTLNKLFDLIDGYMYSGDYYGAAVCVADFTYSEYKKAQGEPGGSGVAKEFPVQYIYISLVVGFIVGLIIVLVKKSKMKLNPPTDAFKYVDGKLTLTRANELFMYANVTKVRRESSNNSGARGGSSHISSSGHSHGGGGRHF